MDHEIATGTGRSVLRWGGLAGVLGAILFLVVFGIVGTFVGTTAGTPEELVARFPDIRTARIVENGLYLGVMALWAIHIAALCEALRGQHPAAALFGRVLATFGLIVLAVGALPHIATTPISDLYHAPGATSEQQATLVQLFLATQGIFDALLVTGLLVLPLGVIALGSAMRSTPAFGAMTGGLTIGLGVIAFASGVINLVEVSASVALGIFALIIFHFVVGWKSYRLSREPDAAPVRATGIREGWSPS
jgi:hypothetical protein